VRELYQKLCAEDWIKPWLDQEELYPGQDWNLEIEKAVEAADVILVCLSNNSVNKDMSSGNCGWYWILPITSRKARCISSRCAWRNVTLRAGYVRGNMQITSLKAGVSAPFKDCW
jgi:hypothetical protein